MIADGFIALKIDGLPYVKQKDVVEFSCVGE